MKRREVIAERGGDASGSELQASELPDAPLDPLACKTYLTVAQAAQYLNFSSPRAFYVWAWTHKLPSVKVGRMRQYRRRDLEDFIHGRYNVLRFAKSKGDQAHRRRSA